jgi:hypothetical protein
MSTFAQTTANRANAKLSTGPKTPEGIANSRFNAIRHGLTSSQIVLRDEDPAAYDELHISLIETYRPETEVEAMMVERVAQSWWKLQRAERIEARLMSQLGAECCFMNDRAAKKWNNFMRHRTAVERAWRHATQELTKLISARKKVEAEAVTRAAAAGSVTAAQPNGFVLSMPRQSPASAVAVAHSPATGYESLPPGTSVLA